MLAAEQEMRRYVGMCLINPLPRRHYTENHDRALRFLEKYFPELERGRTIQGGDRIETTLGAGDISPPAPFQLVYFFTKPYRDCVINIMERRRATPAALILSQPTLPRGLIWGRPAWCRSAPNRSARAEADWYK